VFTLYRPIAAVLAALATFAVFATLDLRALEYLSVQWRMHRKVWSHSRLHTLG
jgi:hypothetical protein